MLDSILRIAYSAGMEPNVIPFTPREADEHPPRCPECSGIVTLSFGGQLLPPGVGFCVVHNVVRYYQGRRDDRRD